MLKFYVRFHNLVNERGASMPEYALLVSLIAIVALAAAAALGTAVSGTLGGAAAGMSGG